MPSNESSAKYRPRADAVIIAALAAGATQGGAAEQAGVSVSTVQRRLQDESFRAEVDAARREMMSRTVGLLAEAATGAVAVLVEIAGDDAQPAGARVTAARSILSAQHQAVELVELATRVAELEGRIAAINEAEKARAA